MLVFGIYIDKIYFAYKNIIFDIIAFVCKHKIYCMSEKITCRYDVICEQYTPLDE